MLLGRISKSFGYKIIKSALVDTAQGTASGSTDNTTNFTYGRTFTTTFDNADTSDETPHPEDTADFRNFVRRQDDVTRATDGPLQHYSWPAIPPPQTSDKLEGGNSGQMPSSPPVLTPLPSKSSEVAPSILSTWISVPIKAKITGSKIIHIFLKQFVTGL